MARKPKSTTLYAHPFCKGYWLDAVSELKDTRMLVVAALLIAMRVATKQIAIPIAPNLYLFRASTFINALSAMIIGPVLAIPAAFISDLLGVMLSDGLGAYFFPYALQEVGGSVIWALLLYRAKATPWRVMIGRFSICLVINVLLGLWCDKMYAAYIGNSAAAVAITVPKVLKNTFMFPLEAVAMTFFLRVLVPVTNRAGLTYTGADAKESLTFTKKQLVALALLFVVGCGCVFTYLGYYYDNTSMSASYTAADRKQHNKDMAAIVKANDKSFAEKEIVTIVESAYKKFLTGEITYTVAIYEVDKAQLEQNIADKLAADPKSTYGMETLWGYSKSPAKKDNALVAVGSVILCVDKNGNVLSFIN